MTGVWAVLFKPEFLIAVVVAACLLYAALYEREKSSKKPSWRSRLLFFCVHAVPFLGVLEKFFSTQSDSAAPVDAIQQIRATVKVEVQAVGVGLTRYRQRLEDPASGCLTIPVGSDVDSQGNQTVFLIFDEHCFPDPAQEPLAYQALSSLRLHLKLFDKGRGPDQEELGSLQEPDYTKFIAARAGAAEGDSKLFLWYHTEKRVFLLFSIIEVSPANLETKSGGGALADLAGGALLVQILSPEPQDAQPGETSIRMAHFELHLISTREIVIPASGVQPIEVPGRPLTAYLYQIPE